MPLTIAGPIRWNDGTEGAVEQEEFRREPTHHAFNAYLEVKHASGAKPIRGRLRFVAEAYDRLPGENDQEKSQVVFNAFADRIRKNGLKDGFELSVDTDDSGVVFYDLSD